MLTFLNLQASSQILPTAESSKLPATIPPRARGRRCSRSGAQVGMTVISHMSTVGLGMCVGGSQVNPMTSTSPAPAGSVPRSWELGLASSSLPSTPRCQSRDSANHFHSVCATCGSNTTSGLHLGTRHRPSGAAPQSKFSIPNVQRGDSKMQL